MGLSSLPAPSEGMLCIILVNAALTLSIFKNFIRSIVYFFGFWFSAPSSRSPPPPPTTTTESAIIHPPDFSEFSSSSTATATYMEQFRGRTPTVRFDSVCSLDEREHECSVCLTEFKPHSGINRLSCGHIFHNVCLERWLDYCNISCPLCRKSLMPEEDGPSCIW
ncbi:hypothetical protein SAY86_028080 [Trapa natans]|uniref:RING-type domain-containing protein n=1 Tax=Trapa natans TaxID=22666 RepID=A0AAN7R8C1_TRANT|nr:hypothetical protein SAY86_028080 [Trapa natans]